MVFKDFTKKDLRTKLKISITKKDLFNNVPPLVPSAWLQDTLRRTSVLPLSSEKSRSEAVVFPVLLEIQSLNIGKVTFFSGEMLDVDKSIGLIGECDFIFSKETESLDAEAPILALVEAKK